MAAKKKQKAESIRIKKDKKGNVKVTGRADGIKVTGSITAKGAIKRATKKTATTPTENASAGLAPSVKAATPEQVAESIQKLSSTLKGEEQLNPLTLKALPPQAITISTNLDNIAAQVAILEVNDASTLARGTEMVTQLATMKKKWEETRKGITQPMMEAKKRIDALFKPGETKLEEADRELRKKLLQYHTQQAEQVTQQRTELIEKAKEAQAAGDADKAAELAIQATSQAAMEKTVLADSGSMQFKDVWTFEVEDLGKVPLEYMSFDEKKVRAAINAGQRDIPGIRIFQKKQLAVSGSTLPVDASVAQA